MKKKLSSILGVSLALVLAFTLVGGFMPADQAQAQGVTPNQWNTMTIPSATGEVLRVGAVVADIAVAADAGLDTGTIWAIDDGSGGAAWAVLKSNDGGNTFNVVFDAVTNLPNGWTAANPPKLIAVAPDDPTVAVVVEDFGAANVDSVWLTKTDGATWSEIAPTVGPFGAIPGVAGDSIYAIDVGPARSDALLGRDIIVATADIIPWDGGAVAVNWGGGSVYWVGTTTTWQRVGLPPGAATFYDYTSVKFAPNWLGTRDFVSVASDNVTGTYFQVRRIQSESPLVVVTVCNILIQVTGATSPTEVDSIAAPATGIISSALDLPADADFTSAGMSTGYVGWTSTYTAATGPSDDAYRIDRASALGASTVRKLGIGNHVGIQSISFSGTVLGGGALFASESAYALGAMIWHSEDPNVAMPSWWYSPKWPTGTVATTVIASPDFAESKIVFAGTIGNNAGFSRSTNGGVSYNQLSLIDCVAAPIAVLDDVMPAPDNSVVFLSTNDTAASSLWRSKVPTTNASWERVLLRGAAAYMIRLSPDYLDDSTLYFCAGADIRVSHNKGEVFLGRTAPAAITDFVVESKSVVYMANGPNVHKSTNTGTRFELPVNADVGTIWSLAMAPTYPEKPVAGNLLVGGGVTVGGSVSLSTDSAATFTRLLPFYAGATNMQVLAHKNYADNKYVYAGSNTAGDGILRYKVGESAEWEQILTAANIAAAGAGAPQMTGLAMHCGNLYGSWNDATVVAQVASGAFRSVHGYPLAPMPLTSFDNCDVGAVTNATTFTRVPSALRAAGNDTTVGLWAIATNNNTLLAYSDTMAKTKVDVKVPAKVSYDPNARASEQFIIKWNQISNDIAYQVEIYSDDGRVDLVVAAPLSPAYVAASPPTPTWVVPAGTLSQGQVYYAFVRARNQATGDGIRNPWSAAAKFTVEAGVPIEVPYPSPQILGPAPGATGASITPGFAWGAYHGAVKYEFELGTDPGTTARGYFVDALVGLTGDNALASTAWQCDITLDYATNYYWHVKAITATGETPWSTSVFTTMAAEEVPAPPAPPVELPAPITPAWIWAIVVIGGILVIVVIVLIFVTRKP